MKPARSETTDRLTPSQRQAVIARGNVLVMAGAGTGKTHTLIERCLHCLDAEEPPASLGEILVVTFTEAAAAEMRRRLRERLEEKSQAEPEAPRWAEQLALFDTAHISTLHSFCLRLVREHFHELGLDPELAVLDEGEARLLADETLDEELKGHYAGQAKLSDAIQNLIQVYGNGRDQTIRQGVLRLHHYAQTRPDADGWLTRQIEKFARPAPDEWRQWLMAAVRCWRDEWLAVLEQPGPPNEKAAELAGILRGLPENFSREAAAGVLGQIISADGNWPAKRKTILREPLADLFADASFLVSLAAVKDGHDPLVEDWGWVRHHMDALLRLTQNFAARFAARKRNAGVLDFHDLEQFALKLLWDFAANQPTTVAGCWRKKIRFIFVDEYQDINAAQDKIIQALSRDSAGAPPSAGSGSRTNEGNRFLVGDVKQSIYRFRLADPAIFRNYAQSWRGEAGRTIPLVENFRSREALLQFVNSLFEPLMREEVGGVGYDAGARLQFGAPEQRAELGMAGEAAPRAELLLRFKNDRSGSEPGLDPGPDDVADLPDTEKEARLLARRLKQLNAENHEVWDPEKACFRPAEWRDMAVLMRAPAGKAEIYAKEFLQAGVPLVIERGRFYDGSEIMDLLSLLQLIDNPLQDVPAIAVLRSPLVGLSIDDLAQVRLAADGHFWTALNRTRVAECGLRTETAEKIGKFLDRFSHWRQLARQVSLSQCLEAVLAETHYADWLLTRPRGAQQQANVARFLGLAGKFDQFQRQGLFRFLKFIGLQREAGVEPDVAAVADENAVRLMSIHQSKGLEFPIVAVADLAKPFNTQDLRGEIIFDESFGLCPRIQPPHTGRRYPSLPHWLAQQHQRRELWSEELRLLYVALTRARDTLILTAAIPKTKWELLWSKPGPITARAIVAAKSYADWLGLWFANNSVPGQASNATEGATPNLRWRLADELEFADEPADKPREKDLPPLDNKILQRLEKTLAWTYPFVGATERAAKASVTLLRRRATDEQDGEAEPVFPAAKPVPALAPLQPGLRTGLPAAHLGRAYHKFLQFVVLEKAGEIDGLKSEAERLERENILSAEERPALNLGNIAGFWTSEKGRRILAQVSHVRRELAFTVRFSPVELQAIAGIESAAGLDDEFVVVQGVADLVVLLPEEIWLVDFKTDDIRRDGLADKVKGYAPQLKLYARALEKIYARPVTARWLHFLAAGRTEEI